MIPDLTEGATYQISTDTNSWKGEYTGSDRGAGYHFHYFRNESERYRVTLVGQTRDGRVERWDSLSAFADVSSFDGDALDNMKKVEQVELIE